MARNRHWRLSGFAGTFGVNPDPVSGGADRPDKIEIRRTARLHAVDEHALVSSDDIATAARDLPLLQVARAWVLAPTDTSPQTGEVTLVAMRSRPQGTEPVSAPETPRWLDAVRSRLAARMLLGTRLVVVGPRYVEFVVRAKLKVQPGRDPDTVKVAVTQALRQRLTLVKLDDAREPREPGVPVSRRDAAAWMRSVDGVREVTQLQFVLADGKVVEDIQVPRNALPKIDLGASLINVSRADAGDRP
jgi:predicted phage baseplate assembly protein